MFFDVNSASIFANTSNHVDFVLSPPPLVIFLIIVYTILVWLSWLYQRDYSDCQEGEIEEPEEVMLGTEYEVSVVCQNYGKVQRMNFVKGYDTAEALKLSGKYCSRCGSSRLKAEY